LQGDLSLVGPRPALPSQMLEYDDIGRRRLLVRPGLTGLAQIHGGVYLTWPERWRYDAVYVERLSFALDVWIALWTVPVVLLGEEKFLKRPVEPPAAAPAEAERKAA
jgi:lipopolysaccharide/colanic/teichoic acid biosynthesis glycosyltransferase